MNIHKNQMSSKCIVMVLSNADSRDIPIGRVSGIRRRQVIDQGKRGIMIRY